MPCQINPWLDKLLIMFSRNSMQLISYTSSTAMWWKCRFPPIQQFLDFNNKLEWSYYTLIIKVTRDVNRKLVFKFIFLSKELHKTYQMSDKINLRICLMLHVYKSFHQMVKDGLQKTQLLQESITLET